MKNETKGVETLLGNPKKAVIAMAVPITVGMIAQSANNLIDSVWVAGLGTNALAAVGFVFPLFFILIGVGNGIGVGASSAIARQIGRGDKDSAEKAMAEAVVLTVIGGLAAMILLLIFQRDILALLGAADTLDMCVEYGTPIFLCTVLLLLNGLLSNLLRSEGAAKRSMMTQIAAAIINIILDPFFIYSDVASEVFNIDLGFSVGLGLGMAGAAWATIIAIAVSFMMMLYWYFAKRDTFLTFRKKYLGLEKDTVTDILRVGIPASLEMIVMSIFSMFMNVIIAMSEMGTDGVAVYSSDWRLINLLMIPLMAIGAAVVPVFAAAYGARRIDKMKTAYMYSIKICLVLMILIGAVSMLCADFMVMIFTYSDSTAGLRDQMALALRIVILFLPFASWGFVAGGFFQAMGMGAKSLICTVLRNGLQLPASYILVTTVGTFISIIWGLTAMEIIGSIFAGAWSYLLLKGIMKRFVLPDAGVPGES